MLFFTLIIAFSLVQSVSAKAYHKRSSNAALFNVLKSVAALLCMIGFGLFGFQFHMPTLIYGMVFGLLLAISMYVGYRALCFGPLSFTSLISSFSIVIPILYGIFFCHEDVTLWKALGLILVAGAICLSVKRNKEDTTYQYKKWALYVAITFLSNGLCSVVQKMHQTAYPSEYSAEFMIFAMAVCLLAFLPSFFFNLGKPSEKVEKKIIRTAVLFSLLAGVACGVANLLTILLAGEENASVMYPIISVGTIFAAQVYGVIVYKERLSAFRIAALLCGIVSVVLLKL